MSIQRLHPVTDYNSVWVEPDPDGEYVTYADHVAQVEAMRAACIAAVEEVDGGRAVLIFRRNVLSALLDIKL